MKELERLLIYIRRTNPEMTMGRLMEELDKCQYSSLGLIVTWKNVENYEKPVNIA